MLRTIKNIIIIFKRFFYLELGNITFPELPQETILEVNLNTNYINYIENTLIVQSFYVLERTHRNIS